MRDKKTDKDGNNKTDFFSAFFKSKPVKIFNFLNDMYSIFHSKIDKEFKKIQKKVKNLIVESFLSLFAIIFLLIGGTMYLPKIFPSLTNGLNFVVVGVTFLVIAFFHYLATK